MSSAETCGDWDGECVDPTYVREDDDVECCASCGDCESACCREPGTSTVG